MTEGQQAERVRRGIALANTQRPIQIGESWIVNGWLCDTQSCACWDHEYTGATCKHMTAAQIWESKNNRIGA